MLEEDAESFTTILLDRIPVDSLGEVYIKAMGTHRSNFNLTTSDFLRTYDAIRAKVMVNPSECKFCEWFKKNEDKMPCPFHKK